MSFFNNVVFVTPEQSVKLFFKQKVVLSREEALHDLASEVNECLEEELVFLIVF